MAWTNISKPATSSWVSVAKPSTSNYINVAKPTGASLIEPGMYMGCLGLTYSEQLDGSLWVMVPKPQ